MPAGRRHQGGYRTTSFSRFNGRNVAAAWAYRLDLRQPRVDGGATGQQLTTSSTIGAGIEHYWTPALRTSSSAATRRRLQRRRRRRCSARRRRARSARWLVLLRPVAHRRRSCGCNPDFNVWNVGMRTIWNPAPHFDVGLEVMYTSSRQKHDPDLVAFNFAGAGGRRGRPLRPVERERLGARSCASSATSGHDRLITAQISWNPRPHGRGFFFVRLRRANALPLTRRAN